MALTTPGNKITPKAGAALFIVHHDGSKGDSGAAMTFEGTHETGPVDTVIELTLRQHVSGQGPFILQGVLLNNDMALWMTAAESQVQQTVGREYRQGIDTAAKHGALVIDVGLQRRGQDCACLLGLYNLDTHRPAKRDVAVQPLCEFRCG